MSHRVYRITALLQQILAEVPVGTNLALLHLLWALVSGRLLLCRGALFPALADLGLDSQALRRAAALAYGRFQTAQLLAAWQLLVLTEGRFRAYTYEGYRPVPCDLVGFFRPRLQGCASKHFDSQAGKALPAVVVGVGGAVGSVGSTHLALPRLLVRPDPADRSEPTLIRRTLTIAGASLAPEEAAILDAGFSLAEALAQGRPRFVMRRDKNFTARRNARPAYKGGGRFPEYGPIVRPLARRYGDKHLPATPQNRALEAWPSKDAGADFRRSGAGRRQAGIALRSVCGDPRSQVQGSLGAGHHP